MARFLGALLCLLLVVGLTPASASADCALRSCCCAAHGKAPAKRSHKLAVARDSRCHCRLEADPLPAPDQQPKSAPPASLDDALAPPAATLSLAAPVAVAPPLVRAPDAPLPVPRLYVLHLALIR